MQWNTALSPCLSYCLVDPSLVPLRRSQRFYEVEWLSRNWRFAFSKSLWGDLCLTKSHSGTVRSDHTCQTNQALVVKCARARSNCSSANISTSYFVKSNIFCKKKQMCTYPLLHMHLQSSTLLTNKAVTARVPGWLFVGMLWKAIKPDCVPVYSTL